MTENIITTRGISKYAKENGYDSVVFKNILDNGGRNSNVGIEKTADVYVVFNPNNVKSADPVTYDDSGKVIPLSERFDEAKTDIRFHKKVDSNAKLTDNKSINNGGAVNGSKNTELLEQGAVSTLSGRYDPVWKQSESARKILGYLGLIREGKTQNAADTGASDGRWLAPNAFQQQIDKGFGDGILRALRGVSLSGKDVIGRELNNGTLDLLRNTILKDEDGNILSLYHWTQNAFDKFKFGDIGFHFGTVVAAHDRYEMLKEENAAEGIETPIGIYKETYLNITNPIFMADLGQWSASRVAFYLETNGLITEHQYDLLALTTGFDELSYDNPAINAVRKILSDLGYDGILYYNDTEDTTSVSAIALYPEQVVMVTDNGKPVKNSIASKSKNGLPEGVIKYHRRTDEAMSDAEVLAQHLEENSEAVGEMLRRSSEIDMNERTVTRLISKRLREYGMYGSVEKSLLCDVCEALLLAVLYFLVSDFVNEFQILRILFKCVVSRGQLLLKS